MSRTIRGKLLALSFLVGLVPTLWFPQVVLAQTKAKVRVLVASVSTRGKEVDPSLRGMEQDFRRTGLPYTSFRLVQQAGLDLATGQTGTVGLPNGSAAVTLIRMEKDLARVRVKAPGSSSEYTMTPGAEIYIDAGANQGGKVFLAIRR